MKSLLLSLLILASCSCKLSEDNPKKTNSTDEIKVVGALKNVIQKGELQGRIQLDTISIRKGLFGLGPEAFLTGELLIYDGESYVSRVQSDSSMLVYPNIDVSAPFFVYTNVAEWDMHDLPSEVRTIKQLEHYLEKHFSKLGQVFAFRLTGMARRAVFHVQNLPKGTTVRSPREAHQGQINYEIIHEDVKILGFFSKEHQGIFTHHDSYLHMHLITKDERMMGHLDELEIDTMQLYVPKE